MRHATHTSSGHSIQPGAGMDRRAFLKVCGMAAAAIGLPFSFGARFAHAAERGLRPSVIWLHFQECTGCTETLLRASHPALATLLFDLISLDYHETLSAGAGPQAEAMLRDAMEANEGAYICVVEGAIPTKDAGVYCKIGDRTALEMLREVADRAAATIAIGSCASWGGIPSAEPNPTGATGAPMVLTDKTVVTIPGCPPNPYVFLGTVLQFVTLGSLPALDAKGRPEFAYGRTIHEHCPRRAHFDAGRFALTFGDKGHRQGHCLYRLGCKGPATHASCSTLHFGDVIGAWPIGIGHPCTGCTEKAIAFRIPMHDTVEIERPMPPDTYPAIHPEPGGADPWATGLAGLVAGGLAAGGISYARHLSREKKAVDDAQPAPDEPGEEA